MSHVSRMNESCRTYKWGMSHIQVSLVTYTNVLHVQKQIQVVPHSWMHRFTHTYEICQAYEWVMSHIWMSHVAHMNESCRTYEWVMSHIWMSHVAHMNESCRTCQTYEHVTSRVWMRHLGYDSFIYGHDSWIYSESCTQSLHSHYEGV